MKRIFFFLLITLVINATVSAQSTDPYTQGPVWQVQFVNTKPGMTQKYLKDLADGWIKVMKTAKDQGLVMDYKVFQSPNNSENDWNLMLMYELKNYASLDGLTDKIRAISDKLFGSEDAQHNSAINRNDLRTLQGGRLAQELDFK